MNKKFDIGCSIKEGRIVEGVAFIGHDNQKIADICPGPKQQEYAKLFAAAPVMLAALQRIDATGYTTLSDYDMVKDAISAAGGSHV